METPPMAQVDKEGEGVQDPNIGDINIGGNTKKEGIEISFQDRTRI